MHNQCAEELRRRFFASGQQAGSAKVQVVAALVIRDAVGDAISRQQAAVKPGPWPGRRAAGEALSRASSVLGGHVHERRALRLPALTWAPFTSTSGGLRQVYLYLRPPRPAIPLPAPPPSGPTQSDKG